MRLPRALPGSGAELYGSPVTSLGVEPGTGIASRPAGPSARPSTRPRAVPAPDDRVTATLDDQVHAQLSDLIYQLRQARTALGLARRRVRQVLPQVGRSLAWIRRLPVLEVEVSDSPAGRAIRQALTGRRGIVPAALAAAVLELPAEPESYLIGRSKQAVRTGRNHAGRQGVAVVRVTDDGERRARALELADAGIRTDFVPSLRAWASDPQDESWFAVDPDGTTLAVAIVAVDGAVARLSAMISAGGSVRSPARYLLSAQVFMDLIAAGVSHVILEGSLFLPPGLLHFQRLLGFRPMNIRLRRPATATSLAGG
jgi:hypothetical protein